ncbi:MAG: hypothetical protein A2158_02280 [Chloroflexi bacterium RBG_13_46_14]|nr:MAG: hypothetical protein A2158_02280 [Chloroflexi bacterium RBG_13_46_14]
MSRNGTEQLGELLLDEGKWRFYQQGIKIRGISSKIIFWQDIKEIYIGGSNLIAQPVVGFSVAGSISYGCKKLHQNNRYE